MHFDITCSTDDKYLQHCAAMLCSLFENNSGNDITVHLLHHNLSKVSKNFLIKLAKRYNKTILHRFLCRFSYMCIKSGYFLLPK